MNAILFRVSRRLTLVALFGLAQFANAAFIAIPQPNLAYTSSTTLLPISGADFTNVNTLFDANVTVTFSTTMEIFSVPASWGAWNSPPAVETSTPKVLSPFDFTITSITLTFSKPLTTFGLEAEPDATSQGAFPVSENFFNGATLLGSVNRTINGSSAALFAASSTTPITSVVLTINGNVADPAGTDPGIAQLRYALAPNAIPEPATGVALATGLALLLGLRRFKTTRN